MGIIDKILLKLRPHSEEKILYKNSSYIFASNIFRSALTILETIMLTRLISISDFGIYILVVNSIEIVFQTLNPNLGVAVVKYSTEFINKRLQNELASFLRLCIFIITILTLISLSIVIILENSGIVIPVEVREITIPFYFYIVVKSISVVDSIFFGVSRVLNKFKLLAILTIILPIIEILIIITFYLIFEGLNLFNLFIALGVAHLLQSVLLIIACYRILKTYSENILHSKISVLRERYKEIFSFLWPNSLSKTIKTLHTRLDILILGYFSGSSAVSVYAIAKKFFLLIPLIIDPIDNAIYPQIESLYMEKKYKLLISLLKRITLKIVLFIGISSFIMYLSFPFLFSVIFPVEYMNSLTPFNILIIGISINYIFFWLVSLILTLKLTKERFFIDLIIFVFGLGLALLLVPKFSYIGSSISLSIAYIISTFSLLMLTYKKFFRYYLKKY